MSSDHKRYRRDLMHRLYWQRRDLKLCVRCGKVPVPRGSQCETCKEARTGKAETGEDISETR